MNGPTAVLGGALAGMRPWSPADIETLRTAYARGGIYAAREALPDRSPSSLFKKARRIGLLRRRRWTKADDTRLRALWSIGDNDLETIAEALGRTMITTYWRAGKLGLPLGCPDGWEYLSHAAERCGFARIQMWRILRAAGVEVHRARARITKRRRRGNRIAPCHIVWPADVDHAVAAWVESEPLESAARRLDVCGATLARWLSAVGVEKPAKLGKGHWRVRGADVERAVAHRRAVA